MSAISGVEFIQQNLIGQAPIFLQALARIERVAACDATVLIQGETGTGKELAARAIHYLGRRRTQPFVPVNCGAIPETLLESEFFGHVRGAFTDAKDTRDGVVAQAQGGTLFLDELETLSPRGQVVLLRFLEDQVYRPVGASATRTANVRVIAATNADLDVMAADGKYRRDLVFRLRILFLELPPLRLRTGDALRLAERFIDRFSLQYGVPARRLCPDARSGVARYDWPGNVRELENLIHSEILLGETPEICLDSLALTQVASSHGTPTIGRFHAARARAIADFEKAYLAELLQHTRGNITAAARLAGKDRSRLGKLVRKHGLERLTFARFGA